MGGTRGSAILEEHGESGMCLYFELQGSSKVGIQDTLLFLICLMSWGGHPFLKGDSTNSVFFNGLAQAPF